MQDIRRGPGDSIVMIGMPGKLPGGAQMDGGEIELHPGDPGYAPAREWLDEYERQLTLAREVDPSYAPAVE